MFWSIAVSVVGLKGLVHEFEQNSALGFWFTKVRGRLSSQKFRTISTRNYDRGGKICFGLYQYLLAVRKLQLASLSSFPT
jgi:hypothetical protein